MERVIPRRWKQPEPQTPMGIVQLACVVVFLSEAAASRIRQLTQNIKSRNGTQRVDAHRWKKPLVYIVAAMASAAQLDVNRPCCVHRSLSAVTSFDLEGRPPPVIYKAMKRCDGAWIHPCL